MLESILRMLGNRQFIADGKSNVALTADESRRVLPAYKKWFFIGVNVSFGISLPSLLRLKNEHADAEAITISRGNANSDRYRSGISNRLEVIKSVVVRMNGKVL